MCHHLDGHGNAVDVPEHRLSFSSLAGLTPSFCTNCRASDVKSRSDELAMNPVRSATGEYLAHGQNVPTLRYPKYKY